jgi:D-tagatose-1,6-bisphosphate aldolase subunit GatZ/KbaZ
MNSLHPLKKLVKLQKQGVPEGILSVCSANEYVIEAVMERALKENEHVLIEATANQVNQFGGYTGMTPGDFRSFVFSIADRLSFPKDMVILGGDHLGPLTWKNEKSGSAMQKSRELIKQYVLSGFSKIHIDTSMRLADDRADLPLDTGVIAERGAALCEAAEEAFEELKKNDPQALRPVYVIGSEVPVPGGSQEEDEGIQLTRASDFEATVETFREAFIRHGLAGAWENVIAVVVQPGVEFGNETIHEYDSEAAKELCSALRKYPNLVFEGHSTDYQTASCLKKMVRDGIAILKVGPALTFALREGLFALNHIENELFRSNPDIEPSDFINVMDGAMVKKPENWKRYYHGSEERIRLARKFSFSDRCRYYLPEAEVKESIKLLINNLKSVQIPLSLISCYLPIQYGKIRNGLLKNDPEALLKDRIDNYLDDYMYATHHELT